MDIIEAVKLNDTRIVSELLKQRHDPNTLRRALYFAINNRNLPIVKLLLNKNLMSITREANQETELPYPDYYHLADAVFNGHTEIVKLLLERGALAYLFTEKSSYSDQPTILMLASQEGHWEIVKALVESGANVNVTRQGEMSALRAAASNGYQAIFDYLYPLTAPNLQKDALEVLPSGLQMREFEENADPLVCKLTNAVMDDDISGVKKFIEKNVNVNGLDDIGTTALWLAVRRQSVELVQLLLEAGADPNISDLDTGQTPLMITHNSSWREVTVRICSLLLEAGANVNVRDTERGKTVLMHNVGIPADADEAFKVNCRRIVRALLQYGADVNTKDYDGNTALSIAKDEGHDKLVQLLLDAGATEE
ncbi:MAG: ankyrin repeat domain-containing protein [Cyanobacteriota bacterium]|nr:ankyrin repeat domain-containing protein [Cyanobacteriota bacterium]